MKDPGYISEAAWNQEEWFLRSQRDADGYDALVDEVLEEAEDRNIFEPRSTWLHRELNKRLNPPGTLHPGAAPAATDCHGNPSSAPALTQAGALTLP